MTALKIEKWTGQEGSETVKNPHIFGPMRQIGLLYIWWAVFIQPFPEKCKVTDMSSADAAKIYKGFAQICVHDVHCF